MIQQRGNYIMSYIDLLDRKKSIQAAKHEMNHFSDLYKLHEFKDIYEISSRTGNNSIINIISCLNYDAKEINKINRRDRQLEYIQKILKAISKLNDKDELEYIYYKYVKFLRNFEIDEILNKSSRSRERLASNALFNMALLLNVEVYDGEDEHE